MQANFDTISGNEKLSTEFIIKHADAIWRFVRWNGGTPKCECGCEEIYHLKDGRYKCKHCGKIFSDTTNTILHNSKIDKCKWLQVIYKMVIDKHVSVRELVSEIAVNKTTAWRMLHKVRMYMELEQVDFSGIAKIDEAHIGAWTNMHLKKKIEYMKQNGFMLTKDKRYNKRAILAASSNRKHHILSIVNERGKCKILHIKSQIDNDIIKQFVERYGITHIISDESKIYLNIDGVDVEQCNHSKHTYVSKKGHSSNACENRFSWTKRIFDLHTHSSERYMQLYLTQIAYKINQKNKTNKEKFFELVGLCMQGKMKLSEYQSNPWITYMEKPNTFIQETKHNKEIVEEIKSLGLSGIMKVSDRYGNKLN